MSPPHGFEFLIYKIEENTGTNLISWLWDWHQCTRGVPTLSGAVNASTPFAPDLACSTSLQTALLSTRLPCPFSSRLGGRSVCFRLNSAVEAGRAQESGLPSAAACLAGASRVLWGRVPLFKKPGSHTSQGGGDYLMYKRIFPIRRDSPTGFFK